VTQYFSGSSVSPGDALVVPELISASSIVLPLLQSARPQPPVPLLHRWTTVRQPGPRPRSRAASSQKPGVCSPVCRRGLLGSRRGRWTRSEVQSRGFCWIPGGTWPGGLPPGSFLLLETESHPVAQAGLELVDLLPLGDYKRVLAYPALWDLDLPHSGVL
jgi:hypothetical protein